MAPGVTPRATAGRRRSAFRPISRKHSDFFVKLLKRCSYQDLKCSQILVILKHVFPELKVIDAQSSEP